MEKKWFKIGGVVAIVAGSVAMYLGGVPESQAVSLVGAVFVAAGLVATIFKS